MSARPDTLPLSLSAQQARDLYGWTEDQLRARRRRYWRQGLHYARGDVKGEFIYRQDAIDDWLMSGSVGHISAFDHSPEPVVTPGFVYLMAGGGKLKIGFTAEDAQRRLYELQMASPVKLELLATTESTMQREFELHRKFAARRSHGEWFEDCPGIRAEFGL